MATAEKGIFERITGLAKHIKRSPNGEEETSIEKAKRISRGVVTDQDITDIKDEFINRATTIYLSQLSLRGPGDEISVPNQANDVTTKYLATLRLFEEVIPDSTWEKELIRISRQEVQSST